MLQTQDITFKFSTTKDGAHNSGSEFTTNVILLLGTPGSANAYVQDRDNS